MPIAPDQIDVAALQQAFQRPRTYDFVSTKGQTAFTVAAMTVEPLVFRNGVALDAVAGAAGTASAPAAGQFAWSGTTVTAGDKLAAGEKVKVVWLG